METRAEGRRAPVTPMEDATVALSTASPPRRGPDSRTGGAIFRGNVKGISRYCDVVMT
jgi:hypothetical protein